MINSENKKVITDSEIGNDSVGHSDATGTLEGTGKVSSKELEQALIASNNTIKAMQAENARLQAELKASASHSSDDSLNKLAEILASAVKQPQVAGPKEDDNINRSQGYSARQSIDGTSLMEAQSKMLAFKGEKKIPISVAKSFQAQFGPALAITVNGVRVSIPCDGKTYYINETHAIHAKERLAKVDRMVTDQESDVKEIVA